MTRNAVETRGRKPTCKCGTCRKCKKRAWQRQWYADLTPEQRREWTAKRDPVRARAHDAAKMRKRRESGTPEQKQRIDARAQLRNALRRGEIAKGACEQKGQDCAGRIHAHHDDYAKPLEVRWLCRHHHDKLHREEITDG